MTTKKFSATDLPHPRYSLELGRLSIRSKEQQDRQRQQQQQQQVEDNGFGAPSGVAGGGAHVHDDGDGGVGDVNLPSTCLPRFSQLVQVIEVKKPGLTLPGRVSSNIRDFLGSYCVIENARPELFVRRDFISQFVDKGTIHISHLSDHQGASTAPPPPPPTTTAASPTDDDGVRQLVCRDDGGGGAVCRGYKLATRNNVMTLTMNAKQYHRFGLVAKKVIPQIAPGPRKRPRRSAKGGGDDDMYVVEIDLRDKRIKASDKHQDRLVSALRRLAPISKVYFRFSPDNSRQAAHELATGAAEKAAAFFTHVIEEYALDGCKPVPLTKCTIDGQKVDCNWVNYSQLHPDLDMSQITKRASPLMGASASGNVPCPDPVELEKADSALTQVIEITDWLGYQLLKLDCENLSGMFGWNEDVPAKAKLDRVDVSCTRIAGKIDHRQVRDNLTILFGPRDSEDLILRAMILYDERNRTLRELQLSNSDPSADGPGIDDKRVTGDSNNSGVIYIQDLANGTDRAQELIVVSMSTAD